MHSCLLCFISTGLGVEANHSAQWGSAALPNFYSLNFFPPALYSPRMSSPKQSCTTQLLVDTLYPVVEPCVAWLPLKTLDPDQSLSSTAPRTKTGSAVIPELASIRGRLSHPVYCRTCGLRLNAQSQADQHFGGRHHARRLRLAGCGDREEHHISEQPQLCWHQVCCKRRLGCISLMVLSQP